MRPALDCSSLCMNSSSVHGFGPALGFHDVRENVVDARQVALAPGPQPLKNRGIQAHTHSDLALDVAEPDHPGELLFRQARNIVEVDVRVVTGGLALGDPAHCRELPLRPFPVLDIFGCHAFQPRGLDDAGPRQAAEKREGFG